MKLILLKFRVLTSTKALLLSLLILNLNQLPVNASCLPGDPNSLSYIRRDNNRCEGIKSDFVISSGARLISFSIQNIEEQANKLTLKVPRFGNSIPTVIVQAIRERYVVDDFSLSSQKSFFFFSWSTFVLKKAAIPVRSLRPLSYYFNPASQRIFVPVFLGKPSNKYNFVLSADSYTRINKFEISSSNRIVYQVPNSKLSQPQQGEIIFTWDGRNVAAGRYKLRFISEVQRFNSQPEQFPGEIIFEHNPNWLK